MKRRLLRLLACALVLLTIPGLLCGAAFLLPSQYDRTYLGALRDKCDALEAAQSPRIVVAGGSSAAFGLDSGLLERLLPGYDVVNFGMYAGLGSTVMLDLAKPMLLPGDILIFMPEQSEQTLSMYFNARSMWQAADGRFDLAAALPLDNWGELLGHFPAFAAQKFQLWRSGTPLVPQGVYSRAAFTPQGDIAPGQRPQNIMPGGYDASMPIAFDAELVQEAFAGYVRSYAEDCRRMGVDFLYRFAPMNAAALTEGALSQAESYQAWLAEALDCPVLGSAEASILEAGWFYDTNFHLNDAGVVVNTLRLAEELAAWLGVETAISVAEPEMPALAEPAHHAGENGDASFFEYEVADGAIRLTGLTGAGRTQQRLTIPAEIDGLPVTAFTADTFAGCEALREVVVQGNIAHMEDGSFEGCTALERIVLRHDKPQSCTVGQGLLRGTRALVEVPAASLAAYTVDYFWAAHAGRLTPGGEELPPQEVGEPQPEAVRGVTYHGNGGVRRDGSETLTEARNAMHLRHNTAQGTRYFTREGHVLTGWNTMPDGSGTSVGLGSRVACGEELTLYAQWAKASPEEAFSWEVQQGEIHITGYHGTEAVCVVPETIGGRKVTRICRGAFRDAQVETVILPVTMFAVEREAFAGCTLRELTLFDTLYYIYDESFAGCESLQTLRINAATSPAYSGTYFDTFSDKYDWLLSLREARKIVLFSGSSARFGYDSGAIRAAFPDYQVANMGVYAYTNALPQMDIILDLMQAEDVLLSAPEFDAVNFQFCTTNALDAHFFAMAESNYDVLAHLDLRDYSGVFEALRQYLTTRLPITSGSYALSPRRFDDEGNAYDFDTYNEYGDLILPRPGHGEDVLLQWGRADYTTQAFPEETIRSLNAAYAAFLDKGVRVYFSYTPRNWSALTEESTPAARQALHDWLTEKISVPVISHIEDYLFPGTCFYLIDSHLSTEGTEIRIERIIRDLKQQFLREDGLTPQQQM